MDEEIFDNWNLLKKKLNSKNKFPSILEGEVWWCSLGKNVGVEINGKNTNFTRPILIVKKLSSVGFIGVPLTSQIKSGSWYKKFNFLGKISSAALCQVKTISVLRLQSKMGEITDLELKKIKFLLAKLIR